MSRIFILILDCDRFGWSWSTTGDGSGTITYFFVDQTAMAGRGGLGQLEGGDEVDEERDYDGPEKDDGEGYGQEDEGVVGHVVQQKFCCQEGW